MYLGPAAIPTPDDPDYIHTENFLRERYDARSERVTRCDACPMVFGWDNVPEALKLLYPLDTTDSTGVVRTVLTLTPFATQQFTNLIDHHLGEAVANGWIVPITETHHIRDVAGMIAYPLQPYPRHEPGAWALTWSGYENVRDPRPGDVPAPEEAPGPPPGPTPPTPEEVREPLPAIEECFHCWRYVGSRVPPPSAVLSAERRLRERFTAADDSPAPTCDTCPWIYHDADDLLATARANALTISSTFIAGYYHVEAITLSPSAWEVFGDALLRDGDGLLTRIGTDYSARHAGRMIAYPGLIYSQYGPDTWVVTRRGMEVLAEASRASFIRPYLLRRLDPSTLPFTPLEDIAYMPRRGDLPVSFCVGWLDEATGADRERMLDTTRQAVATWNDALGIDTFVLEGECAADEPLARDNGRSEVFRGLSEGDIGSARTFRRESDRDVGISQKAFDDPAECIIEALVHEFGHVLGFAHSQDARSPMFPYAIVTPSGCSSKNIRDWEIAQLRELWGLD